MAIASKQRISVHDNPRNAAEISAILSRKINIRMAVKHRIVMTLAVIFFRISIFSMAELILWACHPGKRALLFPGRCSSEDRSLQRQPPFPAAGRFHGSFYAHRLIESNSLYKWSMIVLPPRLFLLYVPIIVADSLPSYGQTPMRFLRRCSREKRGKNAQPGPWAVREYGVLPVSLYENLSLLSTNCTNLFRRNAKFWNFFQIHLFFFANRSTMMTEFLETIP